MPEVNPNVPPEFTEPPSDELKKAFEKFISDQTEDAPDIVLTDEQILAEQAEKEADWAIDRALALGAEDTEKEMRRFADRDNILEGLDQAVKETAELDQKLAKLNAQQAELSKNMAGVTGDMMKALDSKTYEVVYVYAKNLDEINGALTKAQVEANAAREELVALAQKPLENLKKSVELNAPAAEVKSFTELTPEEFEQAIKDLPMAEKADAKLLIEKNEVSGINKEALQKEAVALTEEIDILENGYQSAEGKHVPGWWELEVRLAEELGADFEDKMAVSSFKFGLKMLFKPELRKLTREYKAKRKEWNGKKADLNDVTMAIANPKKFLSTGSRGLLRALSIGAKRAHGQKPGFSMNKKS